MTSADEPPEIELVERVDDETPLGRPSLASASEFAGHLARLAATGLPMPSGLRALAVEIPSKRLGATLNAMASRLERGEALDEAVVGLAGRFPIALRGLLVAGARSGRLAGVLGEYVRYADLGRDLRRKFAATLAYPIILVASVGALQVFVCSWIVNAFRFVMLDFGLDVPPITMLLFAVADVTTERALPTLGVAGVLGLVLLGSFRLALGPAERRSALANLPLWGPLIRWSSLAEFCHLAALLVEAEMPLPEALALAGLGSGDAEIAGAARRLDEGVRQGLTLAEAVGRWPRCPAGLREVLDGAEARGGLADALHMAGAMFEARARSQGGFVSGVVASLTLLLVIWGIGFVLTALYLPIFDLIARLAG